MHSSYLSWELCSSSFRVEELHNLFGILLHGRFVFSLFIQSFIFIGMDSWIFILYFEL